MATKNKSYDVLIFGTDIPALMTAIRLQSQGLSTLIIEELETLGGTYKPIKITDTEYSSQPSFMPDVPASAMALELLKSYLPQLKFEKLKVGPITFQNGQTQPFLGFAQLNPEAMDEYAYLCHEDRYQLSLSFQDILEQLREQFKGEIITQSQVTGLKVADNLVELTLNGSKSVCGSQLYYFGNPKLISSLLEGNQHNVSKSSKQKLGKTEVWSSIRLIYNHSQPMTQTQATHVLYGSKEIPCLGQWTLEKEQHFSHWTTFISSELAQNTEHCGALVKELKKQIKRMYPKFYDNIKNEFILLDADAGGLARENLLEAGKLAKEGRLFLGGRHFNPQSGLLGDLLSLMDLEIFQTSEAKNEESPLHFDAMQ